MSALLALLPMEAAGAIDFTVDPSAGRQPISPLIYGINDNSSAAAAATRPGLIRLGGNRWTAYNWVNNANHAGMDWFNWNYAYLPWIYGVPESQHDIPGIAVLAGLDHGLAHASAALITVPVL